MLAGEVFKLFQSTADAAFAVNPEGEIRFWNLAAEALFGYSAAEVAHQTCQDVLKGKGALGTLVCTRDCSVQRCAARGRPVPTFDLEVRTRSGDLKWVSVSTIIFDDARTHEHVVVHLAHDISSRRQVEQAFSSILQVSKEIVTIGEGTVKPAPIGTLSDQEKRILRLFAAAKSSRQVAEDLGITLPTLRNHLHAINQKLRTHTRLEAVLNAMKRGLI
jgi:PAS domain S-box-containing protein